jgi:hypothetical protein
VTYRYSSSFIIVGKEVDTTGDSVGISVGSSVIDISSTIIMGGIVVGLAIVGIAVMGTRVVGLTVGGTVLLNLSDVSTIGRSVGGSVVE